MLITSVLRVAVLLTETAWYIVFLVESTTFVCLVDDYLRLSDSRGGNSRYAAWLVSLCLSTGSHLIVSDYECQHSISNTLSYL